jgi:membrane protein DedA with SNARE-associated domain
MNMTRTLSDLAAILATMGCGSITSLVAQPWLIALALAFTTLLLEDLAIAAGVSLATQGVISWELTFAAVGGGIALGDLALYGVGLAATHVPWLKRKYIDKADDKTADGQMHWARRQLKEREHLPSAVLLARVIPGLRLVTYTIAGFLRVRFWLFAGWVFFAVALWTAGLFWLSTLLGAALSSALHVPAPVAVALPIMVLALAFPLFRYLKKRNGQKMKKVFT